MLKKMKERDDAIMGGLTLLMLLLWLGFFVHRSPQFAGSLLGHSIGIAGAALMLVPLLYSAIKRIAVLKRFVTPIVPMRTLLAWHIYAGILGPILVLAHTGHRFNSTLGIALTSLTILVVLSGYIGRYLMKNIGSEIREKKKLLREAEIQFENTSNQLAGSGVDRADLFRRASFWRRVKSSFFEAELPKDSNDAVLIPRAIRLAESRADLEYAIRSHEIVKKWFSRWLKFHLIISFALYALLGLHVWATIHFGLRWLS